MLRPTIPDDTPTLLAIAERTGVFKPNELVALHEVLDDFHKSPGQHQSHTCESNGQILGLVYFAPAAMTDRTWYLYWIFVDKHTQAKGIGSELLMFAEEQARQANGRIMLIETSGLPHYALTRKFYLKNGYHLDAVLHDYYEDGDNMNIFCKRLSDQR